MKKEENPKKHAGKRMLAAGGLGISLSLALGPVPCEALVGLSAPVVYAAQPVSVSDLTIQAVSGGVSAECAFTGFDSGSGYTMQLYLEKMNENGSTSAITYQDLSPTVDGTGSAQTTPREVETGVYRAVLLMQTTSGGGNPIARFENSPLYDVVRNGENYEVTLHPEGGGGQSGENGGAGSGNAGKRKADSLAEEETEENSCSHQYSLQYDICREATPDADALLAGKCVNCGEILSYEEVPNSAYVAFLQESADAIRNAALGEQVAICTDRWISFDRRVAKALADRPDVSVKLAYRYKGEAYILEIPAGEDWISLLDENGFCGFRYLALLFGTEHSEE
ncbi:MAG: hypothetical protein ACI4EM_00265 [Hominisplanchenecus sp.]